jgi:hypothetical protein
MNDWFDSHLNNPYPQPCEKERLAQLGGITVKQVTAWFSNRRNRSQNTKPKRMKREVENKIDEIRNNPGSVHIVSELESLRSALDRKF